MNTSATSKLPLRASASPSAARATEELPEPNPPLDSTAVQIVMVGAAHGLDTTSYTVPYVSTWAANVPGKSPVEVVRATAERVRSTALGILDKLDTPKAGDGNPPGWDREALAHSQGPVTVDHAVRPDGTVLGL